MFGLRGVKVVNVGLVSPRCPLFWPYLPNPGLIENVISLLKICVPYNSIAVYLRPIGHRCAELRVLSQIRSWGQRCPKSRAVIICFNSVVNY